MTRNTLVRELSSLRPTNAEVPEIFDVVKRCTDWVECPPDLFQGRPLYPMPLHIVRRWPCDYLLALVCRVYMIRLGLVRTGRFSTP